MWIVVVRGLRGLNDYYGPFYSAEDAEKWANRNLSALWIAAELMNPPGTTEQR